MLAISVNVMYSNELKFRISFADGKIASMLSEMDSSRDGSFITVRSGSSSFLNPRALFLPCNRYTEDHSANVTSY